jgi:hypothetical protein
METKLNLRKEWAVQQVTTVGIELRHVLATQC